MILDGNSDKIRFENVTIENAYGWTLGKNGQAEALYINNKSAAFINCRVLSFQDTLLPGGGYNWFKDCFIAGATDFIWGSGKVSGVTYVDENNVEQKVDVVIPANVLDNYKVRIMRFKLQLLRF